MPPGVEGRSTSRRIRPRRVAPAQLDSRQRSRIVRAQAEVQVEAPLPGMAVPTVDLSSQCASIGQAHQGSAPMRGVPENRRPDDPALNGSARSGRGSPAAAGADRGTRPRAAPWLR